MSPRPRRANTPARRKAGHGGKPALRGRATGPVTGGLIPLNSQKLRARALKALQEAERSFNSEDRLLKDFEAREVPAFERWKHQRLGPDLADLARASQALAEAEYHLAMAESERMRSGQPLWRAFLTWQKREELRRLRPEPEPEAPRDDRRSFFEAFKEAFRDSPLGDLAEEMGIDLDEFDFEEMLGDEQPPGRRRPGRPPTPRTDPRSGLRESYRQLCRLLHPDAAGEMTPERREIWHQVQEAYAARDEARLHTLLARVEQGVDSPGRTRTLFELRAMARHFRRAREELREVLASARQHPAWRFPHRSAPELLALERMLRREIAAERQSMERRLAKIRAALQPPAARRRARPQAPQSEFPF